MKENKYDDTGFFEQYSSMSRSIEGLKGAGEWHELRKMLPEFKGKRVLDLGCGFGWHCTYAVETGAASVVGIDISEKMIESARQRNSSSKIEYLRMPIEDYSYPPQAFDIVLSSLAFHYLESFGDICEKVNQTLTPGGHFIFSVEHPIFTAHGTEEWYCDSDGNKLHWPVDGYFTQGRRETSFLGETVTKFHRTLTTYLGSLLKNGFEIIDIVEPKPDPSMLDTVPGMRDELRRPMMMLISAVKK